MPAKSHKKRKRKSAQPMVYGSVFPPIFQPRIGTPTTPPNGYSGGSCNTSGAAPAGAPAGEAIKPSKARVIHKLREALGLTEYFGDAPQLAVGGFGGSMYGAVGGPMITGPGFQRNGRGDGGGYDFRKSPGLSFRTAKAWKVWNKALDVMGRDKHLPIDAILGRAFAKAGVIRGQMDPSEVRLLEMGIEWYLSDQGALGQKHSVFNTMF